MMHRHWQAMLTGSSNLYSTVLFDPILTPLFTAILGGGGITIFGASFSYASIATAIASTAITFGLQYLLAPKPPKPEDGKAARAQAIPPRIYAVGTNRKSGYYMTWETKGAYLYAVLALCGHPISAINQIYLHDELVTLTGNLVNQGTDGRYGANTITIETRKGLVPETHYDFIASGLSAEGIYTSTHRGDGQASLGMRCRSVKAKSFQSIFPFGPPQPSVVSDDALVWDFRDPAQSPTDRTTWTFSKNPVLCFYWHNCFNPYYGIYDYTTALLPILEDMKAEADICDNAIPRASGGTEKRYECNGWATTENDPKAITNAIKASCDGWSVYRGDGVLEMRCGLVREELIYTLNVDEDVVGHSIDEDVPEEEEINRLVPRFNYPANDYTVSDTDFFEDIPAQLLAGRILSQEIDLTWIQNWRQARRVALRNWKRIREKRRGSFDLRLSGINAIYSRWVRLESTKRIPRMNGKMIENMRSTMSISQGGFRMQWVQSPDNIDVWNPATDEGNAPPVPSKPTVSGLDTPTIDSIDAISLSGSVYIRVVVAEPTRDDVSLIVRYRRHDVGGGVVGAWIEQPFPDWTATSGLVTLNTNTVPLNQVLDIEVAARGPTGANSIWTTTQQINSTVDTVAPQDLTTFGVVGGIANAGHAKVNFVTKNDTHLAGIALYRVPTGGSLVRATHLVINYPVSTIGATFNYIDGDNTYSDLVTNGTFAVDANWTKGTGFTIASGVATKAAGTASGISQAVTVINAITYRLTYTMTRTAGTLTPRLTTPAGNYTARAASGTYTQDIAATTGQTLLEFLADAAFAGTIDNASLYRVSSLTAPAGTWDYYAEPLNPSGIAGTLVGPITVNIP